MSELASNSVQAVQYILQLGGERVTGEREQTTIRLTVRTNDELNILLREEAVRRVISINQTMIYILNEYFHKSDV